MKRERKFVGDRGRTHRSATRIIPALILNVTAAVIESAIDGNRGRLERACEVMDRILPSRKVYHPINGI